MMEKQIGRYVKALSGGGALLLAAMAFSASPAAAQATSPGEASGAAATPEPWYAATTVNGFLSASYSYNANRPDSATNRYRVFDFDDDVFKIDVAELVLQRNPSKPGEGGFRVDLTAGSSMPRVLAAAGLFRDEDGKAGDFDLQQAYVSWIAPIGNGLRVDAGKFMTLFCWEVADGYDGFNDNATRSFLFGYGAPATHTGIRLGTSFGDKAAATLILVNGWDNVRENNSAKSVGAQLALTPTSTFSVWLNGMWGPEQAKNDGDPRTLLDVVTSWKPRDSVTLAFEAIQGRESAATPDGGDAEWTGFAGYLRGALGGGFALAFRAESFDDRDGARTGVAQRLTSFTLTPEFRASDHVVFRGDLRLDHSDRKAFEKRGERATDRQITAMVNAIYVF
jgi:hypothetical protein